MRQTWVALEPLDTIAIRDGRAFDAGTHSQARTVPPSPATTAGAIGAAYGAAAGAGRRDPASRGRDLPERIHGPFVARREGAAWRTCWPLPRDIVQVGSVMMRLLPSPLNDGESTDLGLPMVLSDDDAGGEPVEGWWGADELGDYLSDGVVSADLEDFWDSPGHPGPWRSERRVGLARTEERTAAEGMLYASQHLRLARDHALVVRCLGGPDRELPRMVNLGGRGRRAQLIPATQVAFPQPVTDFPGGRLLLYLATPAVFPGGVWHPDLSRWPGTQLIAAAVGTPQVVTTAIPDRGAVGGGLLMWAVPAGSVYYLQFPNAQAAAEAAEELLDNSLDQAEDWLRTAGFGFALTGRWEA
ncbi:type III-B CRISPR module-associated Cmr3 family protein [Microbispora bryophytorum]|uniref:type III-B CRISPR module-associated Cmr3 family protein n=1 Tax=Microbispora bryophytorum TaxID=1460882 RepID=UPI0033ECCFEE